jgi:drug/metabolite transporter (DMT)-like permease
VTGVLGGLLAALMWGTSTAIASRSTRMIGSQQVLAYVMLTGIVLMAVAAPVVEGVPTVTGRGAAWALAAAVASVGGLALVYAALRIGKVGVVAPITSCEGALAAVFSVVFLGEQLSLGVALALAVVACGVVLVTFHAHLSDLHLRPALLAGSAAVVFGFGLVASSQAGGVIGPYWTILVSRVVGVVFVAAPMIVTGQLPLPGRRALPLVLYSGFAEVTGFVGYITGSQHGVAVPAVLASQFAAVAAFVSFLFFGERLSRMQACGAVLIGTGVATVAVLRA